MQTLRVIYGTGGLGREVMEIARRDLACGHEIAFAETKPRQSQVDGILVMALDELVSVRADVHYAIAIGDPSTRERVTNLCRMIPSGFPLSIVSHRASVLPSVTLGRGAIILDGARVSTRARIGEHFIANYNAIVGHDAVIGDFVTLSPAAGIMGNCFIGSKAFIGAGAQVREKTTVHHRATIGIGAIVTKNVDAESLVIGNPARIRGESLSMLDAA